MYDRFKAWLKEYQGAIAAVLAIGTFALHGDWKAIEAIVLTFIGGQAVVKGAANVGVGKSSGKPQA